ncbi:MAG: M48 family metallopeptidase [Candidatus Omnitrophica bacterium]|nr:M48 family metallopeptidase [Candidatus Omnitrophota bacterium]
MSGCTTIYNPATGRREALIMGTEREVSLGKDLDKQVQKQSKIVSDSSKQSRLDRVGSKIAASSDRQDLTYYFKLIDNKDYNAFAIPGGYVYVHTGLFDDTTDDELAGVLAHEVGHIAARHSIKKLQSAMGYQFAALGSQIVGSALGIPAMDAISQAADIIYDLSSLGYSRKDENFADKLAVRYSKRAGYDPRGIITFFRKLQEEAKRKGGFLKIEIFSSHPDIEKRIKNVEKEIAGTLP